MLQATVIVMTIMGCGEQGVTCDFVAEPETKWESKAACDKAIPDALLTVENSAYPMLTASCSAKITTVNVPDNGVSGSQLAGAEEFGAEEKAGTTPATNFERIRAQIHQQEPAEPDGQKAMYRLKDGYALVQEETSTALAKVGDSASNGYAKLKGAVRLSVAQVSDLTGRTIRRLGDTFK